MHYSWLSLSHPINIEEGMALSTFKTANPENVFKLLFEFSDLVEPLLFDTSCLAPPVSRATSFCLHLQQEVRTHVAASHHQAHLNPLIISIQQSEGVTMLRFQGSSCHLKEGGKNQTP